MSNKDVSYEAVESFLIENRNGFRDGSLYIDFPDLIGQIAASTTIGGGIQINSDDEALQQWLTQWIIRNKVHKKLVNSEYISSVQGKCIMYVSKTETDVNLVLTRLNFQSRVSKVNDIEQTAELWNQDWQGDVPYFTRTRISPKSIDVDYFTGENVKTGIGTTIADISPNLKLLKHQSIKNDLNMVPVVEIENRVFNNIFGQTIFNARPDWWAVKELIKAFNKTFRIFLVEVQANRTRYAIQGTPEQLLDIIQGANGFGGGKDLGGDVLINSPAGTQYGHGIDQQTIEVMMGDPKLSEYVNTLQYLIKQIFNGSGYSPYSNDNDSGDQTKLGALLWNKNDVQSIKFKQRMRLDSYYQLFDSALLMVDINPYDEKGDRKYTIDFLNADITDATTETDNTLKLLEAGVISVAEARMKLLKENKQVAEKRSQEIWDEMSKRMEVEQDRDDTTDDEYDEVQPDVADEVGD